MLAQVLKLRTIVVPVLLCAFVVALTSCASQKQTALVNDPDDHGGSHMPWNKPAPWESGQQFQSMTDRRYIRFSGQVLNCALKCAIWTEFSVAFARCRPRQYHIGVTN